MRRSAKILLVAAVILLALHAVIRGLVINPWLKGRLISAVKENCSTCELSLPFLNISLLPPISVTFIDPHFKGGERESTLIVATAERLYIPFSPIQILKGNYHFGR